MIASLATLSFTAPWILLGLSVIPLIWIFLRAIPPAPLRRIFPAVVLLLGLKDKTQTSDSTPWWLLLLRSLALARCSARACTTTSARSTAPTAISPTSPSRAPLSDNAERFDHERRDRDEREQETQHE